MTQQAEVGPREWTVGVSLGLAKQPCAICVVRRLQDGPHDVHKLWWDDTTRYSVIGRALLEIRRHRQSEITVVVDATRVGSAAVEVLASGGLSPVVLEIDAEVRGVERDESGGYRLPRKELASLMDVARDAGKLLDVRRTGVMDLRDVGQMPAPGDPERHTSLAQEFLRQVDRLAGAPDIEDGYGEMAMALAAAVWGATKL